MKYEELVMSYESLRKDKVEYDKYLFHFDNQLKEAVEELNQIQEELSKCEVGSKLLVGLKINSDKLDDLVYVANLKFEIENLTRDLMEKWKKEARR